MSRAPIVMTLCLAAASPSSTTWAQSPGPADLLVEEGNALAERGEYSAAIDKFRAADALTRRVLHRCNIGLAYVRMQEWERAHYYLELCQSQWDPRGGERPGWVDKRLSEAKGHISDGTHAWVTIEVSPQESTVRLPAFVPEPLERSSLWLAPGAYEVQASSQGHAPAQTRVELAAGEARTVTLDLVENAAVAGGRGGDEAPGRWSRPLLVAGVSSAAAGAGLVGLALWARSSATSARSRALGTSDYADYKEAIGEIDSKNTLSTIGWIGGGLALSTGAVLIVLARPGDDQDSAPALRAGIGSRGAWLRGHF